MIYKVFIIFFLISLNAFALWDKSKEEYYKNKYLKKNNDNKQIDNIEQVFFVSKKTKEEFTKKYGKDALKRLVHFDESIRDLKGVSLYKKLSTIDKLANKIHFMPDIQHWKKKNYWSTPLETIGTNYGDTEDISLLKYVLMVKVGLNPRDIQLIKKDVPFKRNHKKYSENLSLFYFTKNDINPLVIDYDFRGKKIYKYKDQFKFKYVKTSPNKHWDVLFKKNLHSTDLDKISKLESNINLKDDVHIFY